MRTLKDTKFWVGVVVGTVLGPMVWSKLTGTVKAKTQG